MNQSSDDQRGFQLTFRSLTDSVGSDQFRYMTVTRVDGASCRAVMLLNRHGGDIVGRPVGLFFAKLSPSATGAVGSALEAIRWGDLPAPSGGDVSAAVLELDYARGKHAVRESFSASNFNVLQAISPVMQQLDQLGGTLLAHPARAILVTVVRSATGFTLVLTNVGDGPVLISDPRPLPGAPAESSGMIGVAKPPDRSAGFQPQPQFVPVPLQPAPAGSRSLLIAPKQKLQFDSIPWRAATAGRYVARAIWTDYKGPVVDPQTVMPMIPDPASPISDPRPYVIRGAAFSAYLPFTAE